MNFNEQSRQCIFSYITIKHNVQSKLQAYILNVCTIQTYYVEATIYAEVLLDKLSHHMILRN